MKSFFLSLELVVASLPNCSVDDIALSPNYHCKLPLVSKRSFHSIQTDFTVSGCELIMFFGVGQRFHAYVSRSRAVRRVGTSHRR